MDSRGPSPGSSPRPLYELNEGDLAKKRDTGRVASASLRYLVRHLSAEGFEWMLPVIISKTTDPLWPDPGASIEKRLEFEIYGETVRTTQSMIIHKLVACSLLHPKLFVVSPNVRIEKREREVTGRHAYEFTQLDFEIREGTYSVVKTLVEEALVGLIRNLKTGMMPELLRLGCYGDLRVPALPFDSYDRSRIEAEYGRDWEGLLPDSIKRPVWVTDIPREFYDFEDFKSGRWDNFDLFVPGYGEILSGARRESDYRKILAKLKRDGIRKQNYTVLLRLAKEGRLKPSAGAGIGLERLVGWIIGAEHVGDIQPFPRVPGIVQEL